MSLLQNMFDDVLDPMMGVRNQMGVIGNPLGMVDPGNLQQFDKTLSSTIRPNMDIVETPEKICYHFELIGIADKEDIDLTIDFDMLRIDCKKPQVCCFHHTPEERENLTYHRHECSWGNYQRTIKVPDNFDVSQTTSCYKNGILTVTVKKLPQEKSDVRKLQIL